MNVLNTIGKLVPNVRKNQELGLKASKEHTKENQLQAWFMGEVEKEIHKRGREMMAWDEILAGNPAKSTIVMAWTTRKRV